MARDSADILTDDPPPAADERIQYARRAAPLRRPAPPRRRGPHPLAVVVHGGSWKGTYNLIHTGHLCVALAQAGIASWNVEYRRVGDPGGGWPGSLDDVVLALRHARELPGIDPERVVAVGHSAGGHLALLAARQVRIRGVVALAAVTDPGTWDNPAVERSSAARPGRRRAAAAAAARRPAGARPRHRRRRRAVRAVARLRRAPRVRRRELVALEGAGHFEPIDPQAAEFPRVLTAIGALLLGEPGRPGAAEQPGSDEQQGRRGHERVRDLGSRVLAAEARAEVRVRALRARRRRGPP